MIDYSRAPLKQSYVPYYLGDWSDNVAGSRKKAGNQHQQSLNNILFNTPLLPVFDRPNPNSNPKNMKLYKISTSLSLGRPDKSPLRSSRQAPHGRQYPDKPPLRPSRQAFHGRPDKPPIGRQNLDKSFIDRQYTSASSSVSFLFRFRDFFSIIHFSCSYSEAFSGCSFQHSSSLCDFPHLKHSTIALLLEVLLSENLRAA